MGGSANPQSASLAANGTQTPSLVIQPKVWLALKDQLPLVLSAAAVGVLVGFVSLGFRESILLVQRMWGIYGENVVSQVRELPWYWLLAIPTIGGLVTGLIGQYLVPEAQGNGIPKVIEAINLVREGVIGRAYFAQSWYLNNRPTIGVGKEMDPPKGLDYALWQGPAPHKPFRSNYLHYNWHWFWHWGNGELGNNGVHTVDVCRWGLGVDFPSRATVAGGQSSPTPERKRSRASS